MDNAVLARSDARPTSRARIFAVIPAHNEAGTIAATLASLGSQTRRPDAVLVVADNCTDGTAAIARHHGAQVFETRDNTRKKAGALNQALPKCAELWSWGAEDLVLVMDADSTIANRWVETALRAFNSESRLGAVGGIFYGDDRRRFVAQLQRNEFARYAREIAVKGGKVAVLTGTATMFRWPAMQAVAGTRSFGEIYDTMVLTEDNEITLALKTLGYALVSPSRCSVVTETMPTWGDLWHQRLRWQRGALENLRNYGFTRVTLPYVAQQAGMALGVVCFALYLTVLVAGVALYGFSVSPTWMAVGGLFVAERVVTAWSAGWRGRLLSLLVMPEMVFDIFLMAVLLRSAWEILRRSSPEWHHATPLTA